MQALALLIAFCVTNTAGVLLLRLSLRGGDSGVRALTMRLTDPRLLLGAAAYGASFLTWLLALQQFRASVAYPVFVSAGYCCVIVGSFLFLGERPSALQLVGMLVILAGIVLVVAKRSTS